MTTAAEWSPSILVVDDDAAFCTIIRELLVRHGFNVRVACGVEEALRAVKREPPDLILTDIMMPEVDGLTLIRTIRSNPQQYGIPTIVVSAMVMARERTAAVQAGADAFLAKPFSFTQLKTTIQAVLATVGS